ncbi:AMP-binding enzyme [Colletotrichum karsti]|uniref:AMP-binding enzyme n=1 Tax=Colletotrichum karsti TaxID=1095194 RepID=A0A9P6LNK1_9PEZI|nr:AMP-binding enzyme [Colletotrichum karsti]KAF9879301.1 AMP-binding enzyme [Colletotrichum karsti]
MTIRSRFCEPIPASSLPTWVFGSASGPISNPHKPVFIDADRPKSHSLSTAEFRLLSKKIALGLISDGLVSEDRVLVFSGNNIIYPSLFLGVLMAGGIYTGASPHFTARELLHQLQDSAAKYIFVAPERLPIAIEAASTIPGFPLSQIFIFGADDYSAVPQFASLGDAHGNGPRHWTELTFGNEIEARTWDWVEPKDPSSTTCCLNYSSGTTGVPKGVEVTHKSYIANCVQVIHLMDRAPSAKEFRKRERVLCFLPLYHAFAQTYFGAIFPRLRVPVYIMPAYQFDKMLQHIEAFRITTLVAVPPVLVSMAKNPATKKHDLTCLEKISCGAAPLSGDVIEEVEKLCSPRASVTQGWGMTEMTCYITDWDANIKANSAAVGELMPNCSARLMQLDGKTPITKPYERGELWVTGPTVMKGYWRNQKATHETVHVDADGTRWMKTGDVGFVDRYEPGAIFHIVDRIKELIKVKGIQVAPAELEAILLENVNVADAAVVGVTINGQELPRAYIVKSAGSVVTEKEIAEWMEGKFARHKHLTGGVSFVEAIPKNPSGKILRRALRENAQREVGDRKPFQSKIA